MFQSNAAFSGFSVDDLAKAKAFYSEKLGLKLVNEQMGLQFELPGGGQIFVYDKPDHQPATFTILNFVVDDIDVAVSTLEAMGIQPEHYENAHQDDKGIARGIAANMGPDIAWFKDPASNILAVLQKGKP